MESNQKTELNRRNLMALAGAMAAPGFAPAAETFDPQAKDLWMDDPQKSFINFVRLMGDTSGRLSPQWWRGGYIGVFEDRHPELLFRLESCEMKRCLRLTEHEYEFQISIFTMFLDAASGEILNGKRWRNPITGKDVVVEPNISGADNIIKLVDDKIVAVRPANGTQAALDLWWSAQGPYMMAHSYWELPEERPIPIRDYLTLFGDRAAAADFSAPRLETRFNTTFVSPFQRFMETPTELGFSVWHASGHKAESVASLPSAYRSELERYRPELKDWIGSD